MTAGAEPFVPEMHDAGKLIDKRRQVVKARDDLGQIAPWIKGHTFEGVAWDVHGLRQPETATWLGVRDHHLDALKDDDLPFAQVLAQFRQQDRASGLLPPEDELERFKRRVLLSLADKVASSQSRVLPPRIKQLPREIGSGSRAKLWNHHFEENHHDTWSPVSDEATWQEFARLLASPKTTTSKFLQRYQSHLLRRAEDMALPRNLTSLFTHCRLVGQIYRILERTVSLEGDGPGGELRLRYGQQVATNQRAALDNWLFQMVRAQVRVVQSPVRAKDLFVFAMLAQTLAELRSDPVMRDHLLYATGETLWLLLCAEDVANAPSLTQVLAYHLETFAVEVRAIAAPLDQITPDLGGLTSKLKSARTIAHQRLKEAEAAADGEASYWNSVRDRLDNNLRRVQDISPAFQALYPAGVADDAGRTIEPPLCEICQLRHSPDDDRHQIVTDYGGVEYLCPACRRLRYDERGRRLNTMARWEDRASGRLAWVRLSLNFEQLTAGIERRFSQYLERLPTESQDRRAHEVAKASFRPTAVIADFIDDYVDFLADLEGWVKKTFTSKQYDQRTGKQREIKEWQEISRETASSGRQGMAFFVLRMTQGQQFFALIRQYERLLSKHFPDMLDPCPLRLAINLAPAKYPFYEHWRDLTRATAEVWWHHPGTVVNALRVRHLPTFLKLDADTLRPRGAAYLHNLASIERRSGGSRILATATFWDDFNRRELPQELRPFAALLRQEPEEIGVSHLLGWFKLTTWRKGRW